MELVLKTIVLGIVEGLTEFIPVSSTAHILITSKLLALPSNAFIEAFSISIQSGAILAAVWYFWKTIWKSLNLIPKLMVAFLPTGIAGIALYPFIKPLFDNTTSMAIALIAGGICFLFIRPYNKEVSVHDITYTQAFLLGLTQVASFIPGVSRAGATLIGGTLLKMPREIIVPFSFLLAIPTILGASVVEMRHVGALARNEWMLILLGTAVSFIVAMFAIRFFIHVLTKKPLSWFGWYRIVIGVLVLLFL
jgi:undecaprenyl-diphosphatase